MSLIRDALKLIPAGLGFLGSLVGIKPTEVRVKHIGPPHVYDAFGHCVRCPRFDVAQQQYTIPPCPRTHDMELP